MHSTTSQLDRVLTLARAAFGATGFELVIRSASPAEYYRVTEWSVWVRRLLAGGPNEIEADGLSAGGRSTSGSLAELEQALRRVVELRRSELQVALACHGNDDVGEPSGSREGVQDVSHSEDPRDAPRVEHDAVSSPGKKVERTPGHQRNRPEVGLTEGDRTVEAGLVDEVSRNAHPPIVPDSADPTQETVGR